LATAAGAGDLVDQVGQPQASRNPEKPVKQTKAAKKTSGFFGSKLIGFHGAIQIGVELENGRVLYYRANPNGSLDRLDDRLSTDTPILSAFRSDWRLATSVAMQTSKAKGFAARETDSLEVMTVINESKQGRIYATPTGGIDTGEKRVPILEVLDDMLADRAKPIVAGVLFGESGLAILYAFNDATMGAQQMLVSVNPENLEAIALSFVMSTGLPADSDIIIFEHAEFMHHVESRRWTQYPSAGDFYGISPGALPMIFLGVSAVAAVSTGAYAGYWYMQSTELKQKTIEHHAKLDITLSRISVDIIKKYPEFVNGVSVDVSAATEIAAALRNEGGVVEANLDRMKYNYVVLTGLFSPGKKINYNALHDAVSHQPVKGCTKSSIETTGGMREIKSEYSCPYLGDNLSRFGW
jgi:hypothetical protein